MVQGISMWNKSILLLLTISGLIAQDEMSFNFQTNGANEDFVTIPHNAEDPQIRPTAGMTLEAWVKPTEDPASYDMNGIVSYFTLAGPTVESGFAFMYKEGKWRFVVITANDEDVFPQLANWPGTEIPYDGNTWTHIAGTYDGATARIFKNGVEQDSYSAANVGGSIVWEDIATDLYIGKYLDGNTSFKGSIDEVRIWEIAKLENEIQASMNSTVDVNESGLTGYWKFNENTSPTIVDYAEGTPAPGQNPGFLTNNGNGTWDDDVFAESGGDCFDMEITEADFPFSHLADLTTEDDDWDQSYFPYPGGGEQGNSANGADYTYKLTLSQPATIYVTTCDELTTVDVQIGIYTDDCSEASWIFFQDDSNSDIYYPDGTTDQYNFECISGYESAPTYANMLPQIVWDPGTYYIVVDDRAGTPGSGSVRTWIGYSLLVDTTYTSGDFTEVSYIFSEGVFGGEYQDVYYGNGTGLDEEDWTFSINPNGGAANDVNMTSLTSATGGTLVGGEETVILNFEYPTTPSGGENLTVGPASVSSIFNSVGVPLLDVDGTPIELVDALAPTVESTDPENNATGVSTISNIVVNFSESVQNSLDNLNITNSNATDCFVLEEAVSNDPISFTITSADQHEFTINPDDQLPEFKAIRLKMLGTIEDENDNAFQFDTLRFFTADESPPQIDGSSISPNNEYVEITFSEGVFANGEGSGAITVDDFTYTFNSNGGNCESISLSGVSNQTGSSLSGGETIVQVQIELGGAPSGIETISIAPSSNSAIFDQAGNAMDSGDESSPVTLLASALLVSTALADSNIYVDLEFSVGIYGNAYQTLPAYIEAFEASIDPNEGTATEITLNSITDNSDNALTGGEEIVRVRMSFNELPSGVETITISPSTDYSIYSNSGVPVPATEIYGPITLLDEQPPIGNDNIEDGQINVSETDSLSLTFTENLYMPLTNTLATEADLAPLISLKMGDSTGVDIPFVLSMSGSPPTLYIDPVNNYPSGAVIYYSFNATLADENGNSILFNFEASFTIRDYLPPQVNSSLLALDNSYIDLLFDEEIFGTNQASDAVQINDFEIDYFPNGSMADTIIVTSLTRTDSNFLIGGETQIRMNLEYNHTPNGDEMLRVKSSATVEIFDNSGNQMNQDSIIIDTIQLYDILPPSIESISVNIDSFIVLMENTPIDFQFNETVDSLQFSVTAHVADSVKFDTIKTDSMLKVVLQPPMASHDSIHIYFSYLEDAAGLTTVDIAYTYVTPLLGDYDLDSSITYTDLTNLIENWKAKDFNYELGPVTGEPPHFVPSPDSEFDIEDGMAFIRMWSWFQQKYGEIVEDTSEVGRPLEFIQTDNDFSIILDDSAASGQIQLSYTPGTNPLLLDKLEQSLSNFYLTYQHIEKGITTIEFTRTPFSRRDTIDIHLIELTDLTVQYEIVNYNQKIVQKGNTQVEPPILPTEVALYPAYPNPFNPVTTIRYDVPIRKDNPKVKLQIFDLKGRRINTLAHDRVAPGTYAIQWHANQFSSGIYFVRLTIGHVTKTQKILLLK